MNRSFKWVTTLSVLATSLFLWSCDNVGDMTQPELSPAPMVVMSTSGKRFVIAVERNTDAASVSAQIGVAGGLLNLGRHYLYVSPGAVEASTKFTMTRDPEHSLRVKLTAGRKSENDVGAVGFKAPVKLGLSFQDAEDVPEDKSQITIFYFRPDGLVEEQVTNVEIYGHIAAANVPHFSLFGLGWP